MISIMKEINNANLKTDLIIEGFLNEDSRI